METPNATPEAGAVNQDGAGTASEQNGNVAPTGEAGAQGATGEVSFIPEGTDFNALPQQIRDIVKGHVDKINQNMVRGFTEKTTKLSERIKAETAKATEAYRQKAEFYDRFTKDEKLVKLYNDYVSQLQNAQDTNSPTKQIEEKVQNLEMQIKTREMSEVIDAFVNATDEKGQKVNADFDKVDSLIVGETEGANGKSSYSLLRAAVELASGNTPQEKLANGYKAAKAVYDKIFEEGVKTGKGQMQRKAGYGSLTPGRGNVVNTAPRVAKNALEALKFAREGLAVPRE